MSPTATNSEPGTVFNGDFVTARGLARVVASIEIQLSSGQRKRIGRKAASAEAEASIHDFHCARRSTNRSNANGVASSSPGLSRIAGLPWVTNREFGRTPTGFWRSLRRPRHAPQPRWGWRQSSGPRSQGSRCATTLGWRAERRWRSALCRTRHCKAVTTSIHREYPNA